MSQESIEIVRAAVDAWNRADFEAWIGAWDERAEFHPLRAQSKERAYHGHDGLRRFVAEIAEEWEPVRFEVDEIRAAREQVVALGRVRARGRTSGVDRDVPVALVGVVRDKKLVYSRCAATRSEGEQGVSDLRTSGAAVALEAAGLREWARFYRVAPGHFFVWAAQNAGWRCRAPASHA